MKYNQQTEIISKMQKLASAYVPEWKFSVEDPDAGSVVAMLCCEMLDESRKRMDQVLHKHKIQYLNLFDHLKEEPVEAAQTYVRFHAVEGIDEPVAVPKGTKLLAENETTGQLIRFESQHGITVTPSRLSAVYATDRQHDCIASLMPFGEQPETAQFAAFDLTAENQSEHRMLLAFDHGFENLNKLDLLLQLHSYSEEAACKASEVLGSDKVEITLCTPEEEIPFDRVEDLHGSLHLVKEAYTPVKTELDGVQRFVLAFCAKELCTAELSKISLVFANENLPADEVYCSGILQNTEHFIPFEKPMQIYAECGFECTELFSRRGAKAEVSFELSYEQLEQALPEYTQEMNYRFIMKQPRPMPKPAVVQIHADRVMLEYYGENGWKRLVPEESATLIFNGSEHGKIVIPFTVPDDLTEKENFPGDYRMRFRLVQADNLYSIPSVQHCPVIEHLRFSYTYESQPVMPDRFVTMNNFETVDRLSADHANRSDSLFYNRELEKPAMYFGFDRPVWGTPVSLYFEIENNEDSPVDFTMEYESPLGFKPVRMIDHTCGMLYSGAMLVIIPKDITKSTRFGHELYWLRMVRKDRPNPDVQPALVKGISTNMAQVRNENTTEETFYITDVDSAVQIQLAEQDIVHADVYVNEYSDGQNQENWVRWNQSKGDFRQERTYSIDFAAGTIRFEKNIFTVYPVSSTGPAVKVEYRSYQGADANVGPDAIHMLSESIRYISSVRNPHGAFGGYDGCNEQTSAAIISNMLRTRGRAVTEKDYFDLISQVTYGVRRIRFCSGMDQYGREQEDAVTIAVLIDEYDKGSYIFSAVKDRIRKKLLENSSILPLGKTLILSQPYFVRLSVRIWTECDETDLSYDLQSEAQQLISSFIDPLHGGFEGDGWEIGVLPTMQQILAFLKIRQPKLSVTHAVMTAHYGRSEQAVDDEIYSRIHNPFAMAVNGEHIVYIDARE